MRKLAGLLTAVIVVAMPAMALADAAGSALGVDPAADATLNNENRTLVVGSDIFIGDLVKTGPRGQVQILFADNTELVVGPSSALTIEDYLIRNDGSAGKLAVDMLSGAFRFATGDSAKNRYVINTPTGTIGVRGTEFDFTVFDAITKVILYKGAVNLCDADNKCVALTSTCDVGTIDPQQSQLLGNVDDIFGKERNDLRQSFLYARTQMPLLDQFRFEEALGCFNRGLRQSTPPDSVAIRPCSGLSGSTSSTMSSRRPAGSRVPARSGHSTIATARSRSSTRPRSSSSSGLRTR